jgi:hypothetical protein
LELLLRHRVFVAVGAKYMMIFFTPLAIRVQETTLFKIEQCFLVGEGQRLLRRTVFKYKALIKMGQTSHILTDE